MDVKVTDHDPWGRDRSRVGRGSPLGGFDLGFGIEGSNPVDVSLF